MNVISSVYTDIGFVFFKAENRTLETVTAPAFFLSPAESTESQNIDVILHQAGQHISVSNIMNE